MHEFDLQASPSDPENFPFVVLGNKIDVDGGNSRVVSYTSSNGIYNCVFTSMKIKFNYSP